MLTNKNFIQSNDKNSCSYCYHYIVTKGNDIKPDLIQKNVFKVIRDDKYIGTCFALKGNDSNCDHFMTNRHNVWDNDTGLQKIFLFKRPHQRLELVNTSHTNLQRKMNITKTWLY